MKRFLTTREAGEACGEPEWLVRRVVDSLEETVERFGNKRMIPLHLMPKLVDAIRERREREPATVETEGA